METVNQTPGLTFELRPRPCPTCGTPAGRVLGQRGGKHHRYGLGVETTIVQCERCSLVFPSPFPYATRPATMYGDPEKYFGDEAPDLLDRSRLLVRDAVSRVEGAATSLLDVGCGRGYVLKGAQLEGLNRCIGLEISDEMVAHAKGRFAVNVVRRSVEDLAAMEAEPFDVVILSAVLEHMYDPDSAVAALSKLTRPGSIVYIDVPCEPSLITILGNGFNRARGNQSVLNLSPTWPPYHVFGFNPRSLRALFAKHGFEIENLEIWAAPTVPAKKPLKDRAVAFVGTQINRVANLLKMSNNMSGWARRRADGSGRPTTDETKRFLDRVDERGK
jgi:SAM-dependent methyltransferase